jgi:hypothetical protein
VCVCSQTDNVSCSGDCYSGLMQMALNNATTNSTGHNPVSESNSTQKQARNRQHFTKTKGLSQWSQAAFTGHYLDVVGSNAHPSNLNSLRSILILYPYLHLGRPSGLFPSGFSTKILYSFLILPCALHAHPISPSLILTP